MSIEKDKLYGMAGTSAFHLLIILVALFLALHTPLPLPQEEGVEVDLGYTDVGMGDLQTEEEETVNVPEAAVQQPPASSEEQPDITQNTEESPPVKEVKKPEKSQPQETIRETKNSEVQNQEETKSVLNPDALYKGRKAQSEATGTEGITGQPGDQGAPNGAPNVKIYDGQGGQGDGISYSLSGRRSKLLPKPIYRSEEQGKVVVTIWVNSNGDVIRAEAGAKGTDITDLSLRQLAKNAALQSKFTSDPNASEEQKGTITYIFIKMN
jgi:outer membrane biosynthesis protein TonB